MLPGVPREMRGMLADELRPIVRDRAAAAGGVPTVVRSRTVRTTSIAESALADRLGELARGVDGMSLAYLPGVEGVDLRLTARGLPADGASAALARGADRLRERVGPMVYGDDATDLAAVVLEMCRARALTLAVGESCTGGMLGARLTTIPGSSDVVLGGIIAYANAVKVAHLGVQPRDLELHGAVSEPVVRQMARGARERIGADVGIGITGVAGPGGGSPEKPVGTVWVAVDVRDGVAAANRISSVGDREEVRFRAAQFAMDMLRRLLLDTAVPAPDGSRA
jgi:nicotinamide-nucleotide amidase